MCPSLRMESQVPTRSGDRKAGICGPRRGGEPPARAAGNKVLRILIYAALFSNARFFMDWTSGVVSYLFGTVILLTVILAIKEAGSFSPRCSV